MRKFTTKIKQFLSFLLVFVLTAFATSAQNVITGKVADTKDGSPAAGVTVSVRGGSTATKTNNDGIFKISVPANATLIFTAVGFASQQIATAGQASINVALIQSSQQMNEVVVVAYGTRRRGDLTGSVTAISAKDFQKGNITSSEQLLQGKVSGLQITSGGGSAGGGSRIRIRGGASLNASNEPLIVIDGVPVDGNGVAGSSNLLNTINPNDIESMSVLKDASATALYGSRASNGVIIITTKKGTRGKVKFNFNTQVSVGINPKEVKVLSGDQVRSIINADGTARGDSSYIKLLGTSNTDWQKQIFQPAIGNDNNLSASGTLDITKKFELPFRFSVGYTNQEGMVKTDFFDRVSTSLNLSPKFLKDHLSVNFNMKFSATHNNFADGGAVGSAVSFDPTQSVHATNKYGGNFEWLQPNGIPISTNGGSSQPNPLSLLQFRHNKSNVYRFIGNLQIDYKVHGIPDLHVLFNMGEDKINGSGNDNIDSTLVTVQNTGGRLTSYKQSKVNQLVDIGLFYSKELKKLNTKFDVLVQHSYQDFWTWVNNYASFSQRTAHDTINGTAPTFATDKPEYRLDSYLGRINLTIANKYLLTGSLRRDASSKFAYANRVGYFPAFAAAWKLKDEFFKNANVINDLKLRFSYGITGQQDGIGYYSYLPVYNRSNSTAQYQFGSTYFSFLRPGAYDANLKWETTATTNLGLDFGFLKNRIFGSVDFYIKKTRDLLSVIPVAPGANFDIQLLTNVGNMENKGIELTLNTVPIKNNDLTWELGGNFTYNKSTITNLLKQPDPNFKGIDVSGISGGTGNNIGKFAVGYAPYSFFVYKQVYNPIPGKPIEGLYEDVNRDGMIDANDRYLYKKPAPDFLLGLNTQVSYKMFTLGLAGHGAFGNYLYNNFASGNGVLRNIKNPLLFIQNGSANYMQTQFSNNQYLSDYYIENASYFRLDNINLGYNVGKVWNNKATLRVSASVQNVFVITKYTGLDPENASDSGVDNNIYPRPMVFSLGANLDF